MRPGASSGLRRAHWNLGNALRELGTLDEAVEAAARACGSGPDVARGHLLLANALAELAPDSRRPRPTTNEPCRCSPTLPWPTRTSASSRLRRGDFERGWLEYEWHRQADGVPLPETRHGQPFWDGKPLASRTILLYGEQGLGDQIQFARFARLFAGQAVMQVDDRLVRLLTQVNSSGRVIGLKQTPPRCDVHAAPDDPAADSAHDPGDNPSGDSLSGRRTGESRAVAATLGRRSPVSAWACSGKATSRIRATASRSFPLADPRTAGRAIPGVQLISLQKGAGQEQIGQCPWVRPNRRITG